MVYNEDVTARISPETEAEIVRRYEAGDPTREIPGAVGVSRGTVYNVLERAGVRRVRPTGAKLKPLSEEELAAIDRMRRGGASTEDIGKALHIGNERINRAYDLLGLPRYRGCRNGRIYRTGGYVYVLVQKDDPFACMATKGTSRYVAEHRLVMARHLGRALLPSETVHHINGDRADNRIENLELRSGRHGKHAAYVCVDCGSRNVVPTTLL